MVRAEMTYSEETFPYAFQTSGDERSRKGGAERFACVRQVERPHPLRIPFPTGGVRSQARGSSGRWLHVVNGIP